MAFLPSDDVTVRYYCTIYLVNLRVTSLTSVWAGVEHLPRSHKFVWRGRGRTFTARRTVVYLLVRALEGEPMSVQVTPHPSWVADLDATLDPSREAILDTKVIVHASENQLRGLAKNAKIGPRGRWWLEEHAKYDDEHPIHALEIVKNCVKRGETPQAVTDAALKSLGLMKESMVASYDS